MGVPLSGYRDFRLLRASARTRVYEAKREHDEARVVAKVFQVDDQGVEARVEHEFRLVQGLALDGVVRAIGIERSGDELVLLFEQVPGVNLEQFADGKPLDLAVFLPIALALSDTLARIHDEGILHRDIKPSNLLIEPDSGRVYFADFGISVLLESQRRHLYDPDVLEGTLPYTSPEQTGRTKRVVDFRSDLYSLGASFYELLTGQRVFDVATPLELIHAHLARRPRPLGQLRPELPEVLSEIVLRLLEKAPEHRYQSARGLHADLRRVADALAVGDTDPRFVLAQLDHATTLQLPHQLYGREHELQVLELELGEASRLGAARLVLVSGEPGLGKSALIHALETPLSGRGGRMGVGKFELDARELPYGGFIAAFTSLVEQMLTESEARLASWRERLTESLGSFAGAVAELVPGLNLILGELPTLTELEPAESRNRLHLALARFLALLAEAGPLVIVLDDAQWADTASLELLRVVLEDSGALPVLFVVTYRRDEVDEAHPLARLRERLSPALGPRLTRIELEPLSELDLRAMLADILGRSREVVGGLCELVTRKTGNNPLFVRQFLLYLAELGLLRPSLGGWTWDEKAIAAAGIPDDVLTVMAAKIERLPARERDVLQQAACIGSRFDPSILAAIAELDGEALAASLYQLEVEGLISAIGREFQFNHDRIQEAAYGLIDADVRRASHWKIGRCLLERASASESGARRAQGLGSSGASLGDRVFDIVDQLDAGLADPPALDRSGRLELARLNLQAGQRALVSAAWTAAERYLELARVLTPDERDKAARGEGGDERELSFAIEFAHAQAVELGGELEAGERCFDELLGWPLSMVEHARVIARRIHLLEMHGRRSEALAVGIAGLERCGLRIPANPSPPRMLVSLLSGWNAIRKLDLDQLLAMPEVADERIDAAMHILARVEAVAVQIRVNLYVYLVGLHTRLIRRHGFHSTTMLTLSFVCSVAAGIGKTREAGVLCDHALALAERRPSSPSARVNTLSAALLFVWPHSRPFRQITDQIEHVHALALEVGDLDSAGYVASFGLIMQLDSGTHVRTVLESHAYFARADPSWGVADLAQIASTARRFYETLGAGEGEPSPGFETFAELGAVELSTSSKIDAQLARATGLVLFGDYEQARAVFLPIIDELVEALFGVWMTPRAVMIGAIVEAEHALRPDTSASERRRAVRRLRGWRKLTQTWAANCPTNFAALADVVAAELAALRGRSSEVYDALEQARARAAEQRMHYLEAIASERLAVHARRFGHPMLAEGALRRAHTALYRWGARAALRRLEQQYPELGSRPADQREIDRSTTSHHSSDTSLLHVDFAGVLETLQAISEELRLDVVIPRVLGSAMTSAGADQGALLLEQGDVLGLVAEARAEQAPEFIEPAIPFVELGDRLPASAVRLVLRTGATLVIDDAPADPRFAGDPFVLQSGVRSLLCMPIVKHSRRVGALILVNHLSSHAFTAERLEVLRLLAAQAARALDNASVYAALERSEARWRTLVRGVPDIISLIDDQGRVEFVNHLASYDTVHLPNLIGAHATTHMSPECAADWQRTFDEVLAQGKMGAVEIQIAPKGLAPRWFMVRLAPVEIGGRVGKVISIGTDITDRRQAEAARVRLEAQLRQQQRLESIGTLASGVAHEINNPIQGIMNYAELIDERPSDSESVREFAREIRTETERVATIVRNLLAFSRQEREQELDKADVQQLIETTLSLIRAVLRKDQIRIEVDVEDGLPNIPCRVQQIQQIVMNLVTNARDALNERYPEFSEHKQISLRARAVELRGHSWVRISVADQGIGIPVAIRSRIFDPFFTTKRHDKGTGLGLALSHGIAAEHGGELWVESEEGVSTTFHLDLPAPR